MIKVFLADDHSVVRVGVRQILENDPSIEICGEAADGNEVLEAAGKDAWDILMLDLSLPKKSGWEVLRRLRARYPDMKVIILSVHNEVLYVMQALKMGASGYLTKDSDPEIFPRAIKKVFNGGRYICEELVPDLTQMIESGSSPGGELHDVLSEREMQVMMMLVEGARPVDIADELNITVKTVSAHRRNILNKLKIDSNAQLVRYAIKSGLIV